MYAREREGGRWLLSNRQRVKMGLRFAELAPRGLNSSPAFMFCHWRKSASFFLSLFVSLRGKIGHSASFELGLSEDSIKLFFYLVQRKFRIASILVSFTTYSVKPQIHSGPTEAVHLCKRNSLNYRVSLTLALWHTSHSPFSSCPAGQRH